MPRKRTFGWRQCRRVAVGLALLGALAAEVAGAVSFTLDNQSDVVILRVEASPDYALQWSGEDLLGSAVLGPGNQRRFDVAAQGDHCVFDIRVHWSDSSARSWMGRDLCEDAHVVFDGGDDPAADVRSLVVSNQSSVTIGIVEAVPHGEESWGADRLGEDELIGPGREHVILLEGANASECVFDIRLRTLERNVEYRRRNLCDEPRITFYEGNELTVVNESDSPVYFIRVSTDHEGQGWGQDLLAEGLLSQGEEMATRLHEFAESQCLLDLLIKDGDEEHVYEQVDICRTERFVHPQTSQGPVAGDPSPQVISPPDLAPGEAFRDCDDWGCPWMVVVSGGRFDRGSWERDDETPVTAVTVPGPFAVGQFEVSVGQFDEFAREAGYDAGSGCYQRRGSRWRWGAELNWRNPGFEQDDSHPVVCIDWAAAVAYTRWLTDMTGVAYRLLTEAEAELLATASAMNFEATGRANCRDCGSRWDGRGTSPVGGLRPDQLDLSGVFGNAAEWVQDCYQSGYSNAPRDGSSWSPASCERRAIRGGCWATRARNLRASARDHGESGRRSGCVGFRVARGL